MPAGRNASCSTTHLHGNAEPPIASLCAIHVKAKQLLENEGVIVLSEEELCELIDDNIEFNTPIGLAETVEQALFYFDGYVV